MERLVAGQKFTVSKGEWREAEIKVTPEMLEAGLNAVPDTEWGYGELCEKVYRAMERERRRQATTDGQS